MGLHVLLFTFLRRNNTLFLRTNMTLRKRDNRWNKLPMILCSVTAFILQSSVAAKCDGSSPTLNVEYKEQILRSPGYPRHYNNNEDCMWILQAPHNVSLGFGIQVATVELELDTDSETTTVGQCDSDYIELFEGVPPNLSQSLGVWCETDRRALTSLSTAVTLKFHSDDRHTGKGFLIEYALIKIASQKCQPGNVTQVYAGQAPVYVSFTLSSNESSCTWRIEAKDNSGASDNGSILVVEALSIPKIRCRDGEVALYDGPHISSPKVLHWCNGGEAFSEIFLSSSIGTVTFKIFKGNQQFQGDTIQLKLYTQSHSFSQNNSESVIPEINVNKNPVYFHMPVTNANGNLNPIHVSQRTETNYLRLDVMSVNGHLPTCGRDVITVKRLVGENEKLEQSCNRHQYPVYLSMGAAVVVNASDKILVRAVSVDPFCSGTISPKIATTSLLIEDTFPKGFLEAQTHSCIGKYLITAQNENHTIFLKLEWIIPQEHEEYFTDSDVCIGDFVSVYDGKNESSPLLFSTCNKAKWPNFFVETRIISKSENMLVLFNSDNVADSSFVRVHYYTFPKNTYCSDSHLVTVTTAVLELTSPNYPDFYPLDYGCTYRLIAKSPKDVIVIEMLDSEFTHGCEEAIHISNGDSGALLKNDLRLICGPEENKKLISNQHQVLIQFQADEIGLFGKWKMKIFSQECSAAGISQFRNVDFIFLLSSFTLILVVFYC